MAWLKKVCALALVLALLVPAGCAPAQKEKQEQGEAPALTGLTFQSELELDYAQCFQVFQYEEGWSVILMDDGTRYLVAPEEGELPPEAESGYTVLRKPLKNIYLAATSAMSLFRALDGLDAIRLSGAQKDAWYIEEAAAAMAAGDILYAGKYSQPDYELLLSENCGLAVESTMILHAPEVKEKLEELGIPVLIDRSSYESHPLGRSEWIKLYGVLLGKEKEAQDFFRQQAKLVEDLSDFANTEQTVAFFYVTARGDVAVRKSSDYLAKMIELAGGRYIFQELGDPDTATSGVTMTMEDFYAAAKDADYIIYNATVDSPLNSVQELLEKSELFADFKAVKNGNVWCTGKYLYQATDVLGGMIGDLNQMLTGTDQEELTFIHKLK